MHVVGMTFEDRVQLTELGQDLWVLPEQVDSGLEGVGLGDVLVSERCDQHVRETALGCRHGINQWRMLSGNKRAVGLQPHWIGHVQSPPYCTSERRLQRAVRPRLNACSFLKVG